MKRGLVLAWALAATACIPALRTRWVDGEVLKRAPMEPAAPAEVLYEEVSTRLDMDGTDYLTQRRVHRVVRVQTQAGRAAATQQIAWPAGAELVDFRARVIQPSGQEETLPAELLMTDTTATGERALHTRFFQFPHVAEGSVVEYAFVTRARLLWPEDEREVNGDWPVHQSVFLLDAAERFGLEVAEYNGDAPLALRQDPDGRQRTQLSLERVPRLASEDFPPHPTQLQPRWAWRTKYLVAHGTPYSILNGWHDFAVRFSTRFFETADHIAGFDATLDVAGCQTVRCRVERALADVRRRTRHEGRWDRLRPLTQVLESRQASIAERASLLAHLLQGAGVLVDVGYTTDQAGRQASIEFPNSTQFNHALVAIPPQSDLDQWLFIDPHCDFCTLGQLTRRHLGGQVFVFTPRTGRAEEVSEAWLTATGSPASPSTWTLRHVVEVSETGDAGDHLLRGWGGLAAQALDDRLSHGPPEFQQRELRHALRNALPQAELATFQPTACQRFQGTCADEALVRLPALGRVEGPRLYVPLGMMLPRLEGALAAEPRTLPVHFSWDEETITESVEVRVPAGYRLVQAPSSTASRVEGAEATVKIDPTPTGARVTRTVTLHFGLWPREDAPALREVLQRFTAARHAMLVFERATTP